MTALFIKFLFRTSNLFRINTPHKKPSQDKYTKKSRMSVARLDWLFKPWELYNEEKLLLPHKKVDVQAYDALVFILNHDPAAVRYTSTRTPYFPRIPILPLGLQYTAPARFFLLPPELLKNGLGTLLKNKTAKNAEGVEQVTEVAALNVENLAELLSTSNLQVFGRAFRFMFGVYGLRAEGDSKTAAGDVFLEKLSGDSKTAAGDVFLEKLSQLLALELGKTFAPRSLMKMYDDELSTRIKMRDPTLNLVDFFGGGRGSSSKADVDADAEVDAGVGADEGVVASQKQLRAQALAPWVLYKPVTAVQLDAMFSAEQGVKKSETFKNQFETTLVPSGKVRDAPEASKTSAKGSAKAAAAKAGTPNAAAKAGPPPRTITMDEGAYLASLSVLSAKYRDAFGVDTPCRVEVGDSFGTERMAAIAYSVKTSTKTETGDNTSIVLLYEEVSGVTYPPASNAGAVQKTMLPLPSAFEPFAGRKMAPAVLHEESGEDSKILSVQKAFFEARPNHFVYEVNVLPESSAGTARPPSPAVWRMTGRASTKQTLTPRLVQLQIEEGSFVESPHKSWTEKSVTINFINDGVPITKKFEGPIALEGPGGGAAGRWWQPAGDGSTKWVFPDNLRFAHSILPGTMLSHQVAASGAPSMVADTKSLDAVIRRSRRETLLPPAIKYGKLATTSFVMQDRPGSSESSDSTPSLLDTLTEFWRREILANDVWGKPLIEGQKVWFYHAGIQTQGRIETLGNTTVPYLAPAKQKPALENQYPISREWKLPVGVEEINVPEQSAAAGASAPAPTLVTSDQFFRDVYPYFQTEKNQDHVFRLVQGSVMLQELFKAVRQKPKGQAKMEGPKVFDLEETMATEETRRFEALKPKQPSNQGEEEQEQVHSSFKQKDELILQMMAKDKAKENGIGKEIATQSLLYFSNLPGTVMAKLLSPNSLSALSNGNKTKTMFSDVAKFLAEEPRFLPLFYDAVYLQRDFIADVSAKILDVGGEHDMVRTRVYRVARALRFLEQAAMDGLLRTGTLDPDQVQEFFGPVQQSPPHSVPDRDCPYRKFFGKFVTDSALPTAQDVEQELLLKKLRRGENIELYLPDLHTGQALLDKIDELHVPLLELIRDIRRAFTELPEHVYRDTVSSKELNEFIEQGIMPKDWNIYGQLQKAVRSVMRSRSQEPTVTAFKTLCSLRAVVEEDVAGGGRRAGMAAIAGTGGIADIGSRGWTTADVEERRAVGTGSSTRSSQTARNMRLLHAVGFDVNFAMDAVTTFPEDLSFLQYRKDTQEAVSRLYQAQKWRYRNFFTNFSRFHFSRHKSYGHTTSWRYLFIHVFWKKLFCLSSYVRYVRNHRNHKSWVV